MHLHSVLENVYIRVLIMYFFFFFIKLQTNILLFISVYSRLLCNNKLEGSIPMELKTLNCLYEMHYDENLLSLVTDGIGCLNRKFGRW